METTKNDNKMMTSQLRSQKVQGLLQNSQKLPLIVTVHQCGLEKTIEVVQVIKPKGEKVVTHIQEGLLLVNQFEQDLSILRFVIGVPLTNRGALVVSSYNIKCVFHHQVKRFIDFDLVQNLLGSGHLQSPRFSDTVYCIIETQTIRTVWFQEGLFSLESHLGSNSSKFK